MTSTDLSFDDAFVPFDYTSFSTEYNAPSVRLHKRVSRPVEVEPSSNDLDQCEPELELRQNVASTLTPLRGQGGSMLRLDELAAATKDNDDTRSHSMNGDTVDAVDLRSLATMPFKSQLRMREPYEQSLEILVPIRTRIERRKARKARREEERKSHSANEGAQPRESADTQPPGMTISHRERSPQTASQAPATASRPASKKIKVTEKRAKVKAAAQTPASQAEAPRPVMKDNKTTARGAKSTTATNYAPDEATSHGYKKKEKEPWQIQKAVLQAKFGDQGWSPRKRISPDALAGIRALHSAEPTTYTTAVLAEHFKVSAEAVRRILKSKWQPNEDEADERRKRWEKRGEKKWSEMVELGIRPPKKWRDMGVGRAENGGAPVWKNSATVARGKGQGERWIEQPDADLFLRAADAQSDVPEPRLSIVDRIL